MYAGKKTQRGKERGEFDFAGGGREAVYMGRTGLNFEIHEAVYCIVSISCRITRGQTQAPREAIRRAVDGD
jgi:hypothetical protein